jgi:hypothetical protein
MQIDINLDYCRMSSNYKIINSSLFHVNNYGHGFYVDDYEYYFLEDNTGFEEYYDLCDIIIKILKRHNIKIKIILNLIKFIIYHDNYFGVFTKYCCKKCNKYINNIKRIVICFIVR